MALPTRMIWAGGIREAPRCCRYRCPAAALCSTCNPESRVSIRGDLLNVGVVLDGSAERGVIAYEVSISMPPNEESRPWARFLLSCMNPVGFRSVVSGYE